MTLPSEVFCNRHNQLGQITPWDTQAIHQLLCTTNPTQSLRATERSLEGAQLLPHTKNLTELTDETGQSPIPRVVQQLDSDAKKKRHLSYIVQLHQSPEAGLVLFANDARKGRRWLYLDKQVGEQILTGLTALAGDKSLIVWPYGSLCKHIRQLALEHSSHHIKLAHGTLTLGTVAYQNNTAHPQTQLPQPPSQSTSLSHLDRLEAEAIHIMREVVSQAENPAMLYSVGKDSSVMLHLAKKAFFPSLPPFPLVHVDTQWKFQAMYRFRDQAVADSGMPLITHINPEGKKRNINPFDHGSALHTDIMKTQALKQVLDQHQFDVTFGGARRDEEKSRAKERIFSFRNSSHRWQPKQQRPELWSLYNSNKNPDHSIRVFPLSNWTELDIWSYIDRENIPVVPLYFAAQRPVLERDGMLLMVDDVRCEVFENEKIHIKSVRFRTLGCYPLTGAIESTANNVPAIILELLKSKNSEREGRAIDNDSSSSMEKKKQQGYF